MKLKKLRDISSVITKAFQSYSKPSSHSCAKKPTDSSIEVTKPISQSVYPNNFMFERNQAEYCLKQLEESAYLINHTTNPTTFFGRLHFSFDKLLELITYEKFGFFTNKTPSEDYQMLLDKLDETVNRFIDRSYEKQLEKVRSLKTEQGKRNSLEKYFIKMYEAFDCAHTFWQGDSISEHYSGDLYTVNNLIYLNDLYKESVLTYDLDKSIAGSFVESEIFQDIDNVKCVTQKSKADNHELVFDKILENELLLKYQKYENDISSRTYYSALPLIDFYYKYRNLDEKYMDSCIEYCNICISLLSASSMQKYLADGISIPAFKRLVIIYDKKKEYEKALEIIEEALKYDREIGYYIKKRESILKKMNALNG